MSRLTVYPEDDPASLELDTTDGERIAVTLRAIAARFERWQASVALPRDVSDAAVIQAYRTDVERLKAECGYQAVDVVRCLPDNPSRQELRRKFLEEHIHDEDEVRFFVEGAGMFFLRAAGKVHALLCERGDLLSVPAGTRHWFDMGPAPCFTAIRLFTTPAGWVARFTGDRIAQRFPMFENLQA
ncbi:MAG TPA: cupin [Sphingomicrobium sp.]|nr:cupin [Sphingomicrobium sp.]